MTAVEGWFSDKHVTQDSIKSAESLSPAALDLVSQNIAINRSCTVHFKDEEVSGGHAKSSTLFPTRSVACCLVK